ncbi:MAG: SURF1 family protein [Caldilineaceae bacterium]|nr:SURF1 family protein [Caldilineaceae bacterium]
MILKTMFSRRYWLLTLIVLVGVALCIRAAFWQMDRREQKRMLNQQIVERWDAPLFDLNEESLPADLALLEYRRVRATGVFDYEHEIVLKNDVRDGASGVNLITPLVLPDGRAILVARGWVPVDQATPEQATRFAEPPNAPVVGVLKESQTLAGAPEPTRPQREWFRVDLDAIQKQMPYELLPAFLAMLPEPGRVTTDLPMRTPPPALADEYMHMGYTMQWFSFAAIGVFGYIPLLIYLERRRKRAASVASGSSLVVNGHEDAGAGLPPAPREV